MNATPATNDKRRKLPLPPVPSFLASDVLLTAAEAAAYRRQGLSTFWRDVRAGRVPAPIRVTPKAPRWRLADLRNAMDAAA
jgi:predicted DNA-binding transcriptional regulator AlpA